MKHGFELHGFFLEPKSAYLEALLYPEMFSTDSDNKKILLTTKNVRLDSGRYATKFYFLIVENRACPAK